MSKLRSFFKEVPIGTLMFNISTVFLCPVLLSATEIVHYSLRGWIIVIGVPILSILLALGIAFYLYCYFSKEGGEV